MSDKVNRVLKGLSPFEKAGIVVVFFFLPFHIFLTPGYWDDEMFARLIAEHNYNLIGFTTTRYMKGSSRISIELLLPIMATLPSVIWKVMNLSMILLLFWDLNWIMVHVFGIIKKSATYMLALLFCCYPFAAMAQTGWIATTMNYSWVIALGLYALIVMIKPVFSDEKISHIRVIIGSMALLYSIGYESMAALLLGMELVIFFYYRLKKNKIPYYIWIYLFLTIAMLVYILLCPGNRLRPLSDIENWMPMYPDLTFVDKLRIAIVMCFMHFVSIPSPVFFILNLVIAFLGLKQNSKVKWISLLPIVIDILWTIYYLGNYFLKRKIITYQAPEAIWITANDKWEQIFLLVSILVWFVSVLYVLIRCLAQKDALRCSAVLIVCCAPEMVVGISPTVYASMLRTTIYLYIAMILVSLSVWYSSEHAKWEKTILKLCLLCGVLMNAAQITRHIMVYG